MNDNINEKEFLGRGLSFPLQVDARGGLGLTNPENEIEQAIKIVLSTIPGERLMRPEFGCRVHELVFAPDNATTRGLAQHYVRQALARWEPRIDILEVDVSSDSGRDGVLLIEITYQTKDAFAERSIVYPFYISGEETF